MNGKKAKQARRLTDSILSLSEPEKLKPHRTNVRFHRVRLPRSGEFFVYETATTIDHRRHAYQKIKRLLREMPWLV